MEHYHTLQFPPCSNLQCVFSKQMLNILHQNILLHCYIMYCRLNHRRKINLCMHEKYKCYFCTFARRQCLVLLFSMYGNSSSQDCKALQRVVRLAERISGSALPSLQDIYLKRCRGRAVKIIKDSNHPGNCLFTRLPSGKRFRCLMAKTERLRRSFFPKAIRLLNSKSAS